MGIPSNVREGQSGGEKSKNQSQRPGISPIIRFVLLFLVMLLAVSILFSQLFTRFHEQMLWLMKLTATLTGSIMSIFSANVGYSEVFVSFHGFSVEIIDECTGLFEMLIFIAAVFSFSTTYRKKIYGMLLGIPVIFVFNLLRIMGLLIAGAYSQSLFDFMHIYFWQGTLIIIISSVWIAWLYLVVYREKRVVAVSS